MASKVKSNPSIIGAHLNHNIRALLLQFADDTAPFLSFDQLTLDEVTKT